MARKHSTYNEPSTESELESAGETGTEAVQEPITENALERTAQPEESLSEAIREGASDACEAVAGFFPAEGQFLHKGVYNGFYYLSYGVVFSSLVVGSLIPASSAAGEGIRAGANAARKAYDEREQTLSEAAEAVAAA